jgi:hypothetical protein
VHFALFFFFSLLNQNFFFCENFDFVFSAKELAENSHVQDAFVIAVEQQAKERLERLSALRKIKPVDMTKLSQEVSKTISDNYLEKLN